MKWAGGKRQLLPELLRAAPGRIDTYYEPFLGGGALFFALLAEPGPRRPRRAVLNDRNRALVTTYEVVRDRVGALIERLGAFEADYHEASPEARETLYYAVRAQRPTAPIEVAARLLFLNKTCFNGLYRVNRSGQFNVPHGRYARPTICDVPALRAASRALAEVELRNEDFEAACDGAGPGDFVYFDPPFQPLSATASFTAYTDEGFGWDEQLRLKYLVDRLTRRAVAVVLSDSAHPDLEALYLSGGYGLEGYGLATVDARRAINSRGERRGPVGELVVTNYPSTLDDDPVEQADTPELALEVAS